MTNSRSLALALAAGIIGAWIGRALPHAHKQQTPSAVAPVAPPSVLSPGRDDCKSDRAELASAKAQLAIYKAFAATEPRSGELPPDDQDALAQNRRNQEVWATKSEVVIVRHADGSVGYYLPDEPVEDGIIVARRLPSGELGWYAGPDAGPRTDPSAFRPRAGLELGVTRGPDGSILVDGKPASPEVKRMFSDVPREP